MTPRSVVRTHVRFLRPVAVGLLAVLALSACVPLIQLQPIPTVAAPLSTLTPSVTVAPPTGTPTRNPSFGYLIGAVWNDACDPSASSANPTPACLPDSFGALYGNGVRDAGETGIDAITVNLGVGACPSTGHATTLTDEDGDFVFKDVAPGTYCVSVDPAENEQLERGGWTFPQSADRRGVAALSVASASGVDTTGIVFGWDQSVQPTPTSSPTPRESATVTLTPTRTRSAAQPIKIPATFTPIMSATLTRTITPTPTITPTGTSGTPSLTPTITKTWTPVVITVVVTASNTPSPTSSVTPTPTVTLTRTNTPTPTITLTPTATDTTTATATLTPTATSTP